MTLSRKYASAKLAAFPELTFPVLVPLKRLLNHRTNGDVTSGYIVVNAERLREPVELVAKRI